jgi:hypothetical protein
MATFLNTIMFQQVCRSQGIKHWLWQFLIHDYSVVERFLALNISDGLPRHVIQIIHIAQPMLPQQFREQQDHNTRF